jgi:Zn finger protein HypA/HybF involved in hydrogenase expression
MAITHPELAKEYLGDPTTIIAGSNKKLDWRCQICQHEWSATGNSRVRPTGCPVCAKKAVHIDGRNSMAITHPELAKELVGTDPNTVIAGTGKKLDWRCRNCQHEWAAVGGDRCAGKGCPACASTGFQPHLPGYYYVNEILNGSGDRILFKGGISGDWEKRLGDLGRGLPDGLTIRNVEAIRFDLGRDAQDLETRLLRAESIRAPARDFHGGHELFMSNPLDYAREQGWI